MSDVLKGINNFLQLIVDNWTLIIIVVSIMLLLYYKVLRFLKLSDEQKVEIAWQNIRQSILSWVTEAEEYWTNQKQINGAGMIKRSEVIAKIYAQYPILNKIVNQVTVINKIDELIDEALIQMKSILESGADKNETKKNISNKK